MDGHTLDQITKRLLQSRKAIIEAQLKVFYDLAGNYIVETLLVIELTEINKLIESIK